MSKDPAEIARERRAEIEKLISQAEELEAKKSSQAVLGANNLRLRALCISAGLRAPE